MDCYNWIGCPEDCEHCDLWFVWNNWEAMKYMTE
jgi:hypothetical protein